MAKKATRKVTRRQKPEAIEINVVDRKCPIKFTLVDDDGNKESMEEDVTTFHQFVLEAQAMSVDDIEFAFAYRERLGKKLKQFFKLKKEPTQEALYRIVENVFTIFESEKKNTSG